MTSCTEDNYTTDNESVTGKKKKKRFLGFRRRSTSDLSSTRGRVKKPLWFDSKRGCQSDTEDLQLKVYQIDDPQQVNKRKNKNEPQNMVCFLKVKLVFRIFFCLICTRVASRNFSCNYQEIYYTSQNQNVPSFGLFNEVVRTKLSITFFFET